MNNGELMIALLRRLRVEMNGAVSAAMAERGVVYGLNYGVSIPTIKDIAKEYFPNHSLAALLYEQDVRELKLAAFFIDDPKKVTQEQMMHWGESIVNSEIAEHAATQLFSKTDSASEVALGWIVCDNPLLCYTALLMAGRLVSGGGMIGVSSKTGIDIEQMMIIASVNALDTWVGNSYFKQISRGVIQLLCKIAANSPQKEKKIKDIVTTLSLSSEPELQSVADEILALADMTI